MKGALGFDPWQYTYGRATEAVRTALAEWSEIDWFEPTRTDDEHAVHVFREHQRLANLHNPDLFPIDVNIRCISGSRIEFDAWCKRVRSEASWDWKFSVLKTLSNEHAKARGWSDETYARSKPIGLPRPADLMVRIVDASGSEHVMWNNVMPKVEALDALPRDGFGESARFYIGYAHGDALDCIKWQLAEEHADLSGNPFLPLLLCYQAGAYPFSLDRETVVLFRFREPADANRA